MSLILTTECIAGNHLEDAVAAIKRLDAMRVLGFPVRVRFAALVKLARTPPVGHRILEKCVRCLQETNPQKRWWPLRELHSIQRDIAINVFPDHPDHDPEALPYWLAREPIEGGQS